MCSTSLAKGIQLNETPVRAHMLAQKDSHRHPAWTQLRWPLPCDAPLNVARSLALCHGFQREAFQHNWQNKPEIQIVTTTLSAQNHAKVKEKMHGLGKTSCKNVTTHIRTKTRVLSSCNKFSFPPATCWARWRCPPSQSPEFVFTDYTNSESNQTVKDARFEEPNFIHINMCWNCQGMPFIKFY